MLLTTTSLAILLAPGQEPIKGRFMLLLRAAPTRQTEA